MGRKRQQESTRDANTPREEMAEELVKYSAITLLNQAPGCVKSETIQ